MLCAYECGDHLELSLTQEGTPGSYSVSPGYISNFTADWAQLSSSSRLGPTDCASPGDPDPTSGCPCCSLVGNDDEQWSYELLSCCPVRGIGGEVDNASLTDLRSDLASLPPRSLGIAHL